MDTVFYGLLLLNFGFGLLAIVFLATVRTEPEDPGVRSLAYPFIPLTIITAVQIVDYYLWNRSSGQSSVAIAIFYDLCFISIAFFWNYFVFRHFELNQVDRRRPRAVAAVAGLALFLAFATLIGHLWMPKIVPWLHGSVIALLYFAGMRGVLSLPRSRGFFPSSRTGVTIALISVLVYPLISIGDVFGWRLPFLDPRVSFWAQAHPLYITAISIPVAHYIYCNRRRALEPRSISVTIPDEGSSSHSQEFSNRIVRLLTARENEILLLLYRGYRYRDIAEQLHVSITTVRTHVHHIYEKLDISRKEELFIALRDETTSTGR